VRKVDYDALASAYDRRFDTNRFEGVQAMLERFLEPVSAGCIVEVGSGTGHWLQLIDTTDRLVIGLDPSDGMLTQAQANAPHAPLVRGRAESLPFQSSSVDWMFCINALHHFADPKRFVQEARRTLRSGGGLLTIGLDPQTGLDAWWIYDYFPDALSADRRRYPPATRIREWLGEAGFSAVATEIAQHIPAELAFDEAVAQGLLDRRATSQFQVIDDSHWEAGLKLLQAERPVLRADLRLYATVGFAR
jgi:ubiquinone/menaquinone biosynthesis C-methylase UbiE